jgi:hypothetical protein
VVRAVADDAAVGGEYYGPRFLTRGRPVVQTPTHTSVDPEVAEELWLKAEESTGVSFEVPVT